jgi:RHS repeat-associated protein
MKVKSFFAPLAVVAALSLLTSSSAWATGACTAARFNNWGDRGCDQSPGRAGAPSSGASNAGGNQANCAPCDSGMPRWWVSEPYINLWVSDTPLSYPTSSGKDMSFRFFYKQNYEIPKADETPNFYGEIPRESGLYRAQDQYTKRARTYNMTNASWGHNWMVDILFWDYQWDYNYYGSVPPSFAKYSIHGYEALLTTGEGGITHFRPTTTNAWDKGNTDPASQMKLLPRSGLYPTVSATYGLDAQGICWGNNTNGFILRYPDGSYDEFGLTHSLSNSPNNSTAKDSTARAFLTARIDAHGRTNKIGYERFTAGSGSGYVSFRVKYVVDSDNRTNVFSYAGSDVNGSGWRITQIDDTHGRNAKLTYPNNSGLPTSVTDAAGMTNHLDYTFYEVLTHIGQNPNWPYQDLYFTNHYTGWITNLNTVYGNTAFNYFYEVDSSVTNGFSRRAIYISEPEGAKQLYAYVHQTGITNVATAPSVPGVTNFDVGNSGSNHPGLNYRNTYHWGRQQFANLSDSPKDYLEGGDVGYALGLITTNDFHKAHIKHWLWQTNGISIGALSSEQDPSPDPEGQIPGQRTFYNYYGKTSPELEGSFSQKTCVARVLPDGTSQYTVYDYFLYDPDYISALWPRGALVSNSRSSFSRPDGSIGETTNWFSYPVSWHDVGVISNSFGQSSKIGWQNRQPVSITNSLNQVTSLSWDTWLHKNLTSATFPSGQTISLGYNWSGAYVGFLNSITVQPNDFTINITAYTNGSPQILQITGASLPSLWITNTWDSLNRLTGTRFPDGTYTSNRFEKLDLSASRDRLGNWTHFHHDGLQHLTAITNALTNVTQLGWCGCGSLTSITDPLTNTIVLNRDNQGFVTNVAFPDNSSLNYKRDLSGWVTNISDGAGRSLKYTHNNHGSVTSVSNAYGRVWQATRDAVNRLIVITDADGVTITNQFDLISQLTARTWQDGVGETFGYSTNGLIAHTNRSGKVTRFTRDAAGRLAAVTNANLEVTRFSYNAMDQIVRLIDGLNRTNRWNVNEYGWVTNKVDALGREVARYTNNANGDLVGRWLLGSGSTVYARNALGSVTNISYPGTTTPSITFTLDALDQIKTMVDAVGATAFSYTKVGQLKSESLPWGTNALTYGYNDQLQTSLALGTWTQTYEYDDAWRLESLTSPAGKFDYGFNAPGSTLVATLGLPNGGWITNHFDTLGRLDATVLLNPSYMAVDGYQYTTDLLGLRTNMVRNFGLMKSQVSVGYDNIGQLTSWTGKEMSGSLRLNEQLRFGFDAAGNLLKRTNGFLEQTFTVNPVNELTNITRSGTMTVSGAMPGPMTNITVNGLLAQTNADFTFATTNLTLANGNNTFTVIAQNMYGVAVTNILTANLPGTNLLQFDGNGNLTNDGLKSFVYDAENQLTNVYAAEQWKTEWIYDGLRRRRIQRDYGWQGGAWVKTNEVRVVFDGLLPIQERDTNNNVLVTYTRGLDFSSTLDGAGGIGGLLARTDANGSAYYHSDGSGNITALMDANGFVVARHLYDPFGRMLGKWGPLADANVMRFSSMPEHRGLVGYWGRFYEPSLSRWLNQDPIGENGGINLYRFVGNSPVSRTDPFGLWAYFQPSTWFDGNGYQPGPWEDLNGQAAQATLDGIIPFVDPFGENGGYDTEDPALGLSRDLGELARNAYLLSKALEAAGFGTPSDDDAGPDDTTEPCRPNPDTKLSDRVTKELAPGETRTPEETKQSRNFFERNRDGARQWWEERNGEEYPKNATHDEHPRPIKDGGDPLHIEPGFDGPHAPHMVPGPDGLTDFQRWGKQGGRPPK